MSSDVSSLISPLFDILSTEKWTESVVFRENVLVLNETECGKKKKSLVVK